MNIWKKTTLLPAVMAAMACGIEQGQPQEIAALGDTSRVTEEALSEGTFTITADRDGRKCLDVAGGDNRNGTTVQIADCNGHDAQKWQRKGAQLRVFGDKCLNVKDGQDKNGTRLQIWTCSDNDANGKWSVVGNQLQWKDKRRCLDLTGGSTQAGTPMQLWDCDSNNRNQKWAFGNSGGANVGNTGNNSQAPMVASAAGIGPSPQGLDVAPYFWTWGRWGNYAVKSLTDARSKANMQSATIAFGLSGGGCNIGNDMTDMGDDIRSYIQSGGRIILSIGGAAGTYPQNTCGDAGQLANALDGQMKALNTRALDFDIEGDNLNTMQHTNVLLDALKILQGRYNDLYVSFTLPLDDRSGLPQSALNVVRGARDKGVLVSRVNIMAMDFGHGPDNGQDMGDQVINGTNATFRQLKDLYRSAPDSAVWHMIGICPMIGENDDHFKFTTDHARKVAAFAKRQGIGLLTFWGMQRDRAAGGDLNNYSNVSQKDFEFTKIFNDAR